MKPSGDNISHWTNEWDRAWKKVTRLISFPRDSRFQLIRILRRSATDSGLIIISHHTPSVAQRRVPGIDPSPRDSAESSFPAHDCDPKICKDVATRGSRNVRKLLSQSFAKKSRDCPRRLVHQPRALLEPVWVWCRKIKAERRGPKGAQGVHELASKIHPSLRTSYLR